MKCKNCGEPLTFSIKDLSHVYCKSCKKRYRMPRKKQAQMKKMLALGVLAVILIILILFFVIRGIVGAVGKADTAKPQEEKAVTADKDISELSLKVKDPLSITSDTHHFEVTFVSAELVKDAKGVDSLVMDLDFVSTREDPQSFKGAVTVSARQGETRLVESELANAKQLELADPESLHYQGDLDTYTMVYQLSDKETPIVIEAYDTNTPDAASGTQTINFELKDK